MCFIFFTDLIKKYCWQEKAPSNWMHVHFSIILNVNYSANYSFVLEFMNESYWKYFIACLEGDTVPFSLSTMKNRIFIMFRFRCRFRSIYLYVSNLIVFIECGAAPLKVKLNVIKDLREISGWWWLSSQYYCILILMCRTLKRKKWDTRWRSSLRPRRYNNK